MEKLILGSRYFFEGNGGGISCRQQSKKIDCQLAVNNG